MSYSDLLRDPRWQRKRLEVMEHDDFTCFRCNATDKPLHVHHTFYAKGRKPWEYDSGELLTLCEDCHAKETEQMAEISKSIGLLAMLDMDELIGLLRGMCWLNARVGGDGGTTLLGESYEMCEGICRAFGIVDQATINQVVEVSAQSGGKLNAWVLNELREHRRSVVTYVVSE